MQELNADLERLCRSNLERRHSMHRELIGDRFARELLALRPLPEHLPNPCVLEYARVNKFAEVTAETNHYSVPSRYVRRDAIVEISEDSVAVVVGGERVAQHRRGRGKHEFIIDPLHYIELISHKHRSAMGALAFADERLPRSLIMLRDRMIERDGPTATKAWTAVLSLALESSLPALSEATEIALSRGTIDPQAIGLILRQRDVVGTNRLDLAHGPRTPALRAQIIDLEAYRITAFVERAL
jgi:hypothetical protein